MKYRAEIFDEMQRLYAVTGFSDHQIHCCIRFGGHVNAAQLEKSLRLLLKAVPILSRVYQYNAGRPCWRDADVSLWTDMLAVTTEKAVFDRFLASKTDELTGPQLRACLLSEESDTLGIVINHMICDGAGFKQCVYLLAQLYSALEKDPAYEPDFVIDGDRSFRAILSDISLPERLRILLKGHGDSNRSFPAALKMSTEAEETPFIVSRELPPEVLRGIKAQGTRSGVTVNDVLMAAFFRVMARQLECEGRALAIPVMIDMRRYCPDSGFSALTNLASTTIVRTVVSKAERFETTLELISAAMRAKKQENFGLSSFIKLDSGMRLLKIRPYAVLRKALNNPKISMTNIGVLSQEKLTFGSLVPIGAMMSASKKYRPYFQMTVTSFGENLTLSTGLYGTDADRLRSEEILSCVEAELLAACRTGDE